MIKMRAIHEIDSKLAVRLIFRHKDEVIMEPSEEFFIFMTFCWLNK